MAPYTLLTYPGFNETFKIHNYASAFQLGAVISQKCKPISFYSGKHNDSKQRYTVIEKGLISIVETLKGFRTIFFCSEVNNLYWS